MILKGISGIGLDLSGAECEIEQGKRFDLAGTGDINAFTRCGIWYLKAKGGKIKITLPKGAELSAFRLRLAGSHVRSCPFRAMDTELRMADSVCIFEGIYARSLYAELGKGRAELNVRELKSASFNCGMGRMDISFFMDREDCSLRTQRGIGSITVDGAPLPRSSSEGDGSSEVFIKCGLGAVNAVFKG